jgi:hypothetical protein
MQHVVLDNLKEFTTLCDELPADFKSQYILEDDNALRLLIVKVAENIEEYKRFFEQIPHRVVNSLRLSISNISSPFCSLRLLFNVVSFFIFISPLVVFCLLAPLNPELTGLVV